MNHLLSLTAGSLGLLVVFLLIPQFLRLPFFVNRLRRTGDVHHTHKAPVPRLGGLALASACLVVQFFVSFGAPDHGVGSSGLVMLTASLAMFGLGFWDDIKPLGAKRKLVGQILISLAVCVFGISIQTFKLPFTERIIELHGWGFLITVLWLVGMTNLINLIDGADGLAGGICLMLMGLISYVGAQDGHVALLAAGMAGALLAFLWFNFPPARVYLGDGGAYLLGFQIGVFSIVVSHKGTVFAALLAPLFVLALPILDTTLAIVRRGLRGLPIFRPDRRHIHHHLLNMGLSRRKVVLSLYALTLVFLAMGLLAFWSQGRLVPVLLGGGALLMLLCAGKLGFSREWFAVHRVVGKSLAMRPEVQYALCIANWLEMEGGRVASVENLWSDFNFVAQKLGFTYVKLTLPDGERVWEQPSLPRAEIKTYSYELEAGRCGHIEVGVPVSLIGPPEPGNSGPDANELPGQDLDSMVDPTVFEIVSELLAEGWAKAGMRWRSRTQLPLRFDARLTFVEHAGMRAMRRPLAAVADD